MTVFQGLGELRAQPARRESSDATASGTHPGARGTARPAPTGAAGEGPASAPQGSGAHCTLACAGHPLLLGRNGAVREAASPQILLGISETSQYTSESFDLSPGDALLCVTEGVTECRRGRRQFDDDDGLATVLGGCTGLGAGGIAERVRHAVHAYDSAPPADDLAVLVLQAR